MDEHDDGNEPHYAQQEDISPTALRSALCKLHLLGDDPFLSVQALNLSVVDDVVTDLEYTVLKKLEFEERTPIPEATYLSAISQMWMFAAYELLRTWRERAGKICNWDKKGKLRKKLATIEQGKSPLRTAEQFRANQIKEILAEPSLVDRIEDDLRRTEMLFVRLEAIRVSLAKHEMWRSGGEIAPSPGYGRINMWCGAIDYELGDGEIIIDVVNRRDIADGIRAFFDDSALPDDKKISAYKKFLRGKNPNI